MFFEKLSKTKLVKDGDQPYGALSDRSGKSGGSSNEESKREDSPRDRRSGAITTLDRTFMSTPGQTPGQ